MLQICDGVGTLIHSATMSDVNLDILDWNLQHQSQQQGVNSHSGNVVSQAAQAGDPEPGPDTRMEERRGSAVQASRSMFTIITTPRRRGESSHNLLLFQQPTVITLTEKKNNFCSLEMFKFSSKDGNSSGEEDSVPLLDDVNVV